MSPHHNPGKVLILATGGTIAGRAQRQGDNVGYTAGQVPVAELVSSIPTLADLPLELEQVTQVDSKDMDFPLWKQLAGRVAHHAGRADVRGVVITHGTDTLEETAWFLHRVLQPAKPVVMTCAMRPATALAPDGPQNLADAVSVAMDGRLPGVSVVCAGLVHAPEHVTKVHTYRTDAFASGEAGPAGAVEEGRLRLFWPPAPGTADAGLWPVVRAADRLPRVELVVSHADADGHVVRAMLNDTQAPALRGLVVAGTGNGTVHTRLAAALNEARGRGVVVWLGTRCVAGRVVQDGVSPMPLAAPSAIKARLSLALDILKSTA